MQAERADARWRDAIALTAALWLFVLLIFLPLIIARHADGEWGDLILDSITIFLPMGAGLILFALFRASVDWSGGKRLLVLVPAIVAAAIGNAIFDIIYTALIARNFVPEWSQIPTDLRRGYDAAFRYMLVFSVNVLMFQLSLSRQRALRVERQLTDAQLSAQQAQLAALRYQVNPHFLFNSLNSISALIVTNRNQDAEQMTDKLSGFLRSSLACDPSALLPLGDELALVEEYLDIEAVRFQGRLEVEIDYSDEASRAIVPGFLIQPLVENAVKHGVAPSRDPVAVAVKAWVEGDRLRVMVENDRCPHVESKAAGLGIGIGNVRQRLHTLYGNDASIRIDERPDSYCVSLDLPRRLDKH